MSKFNQGLITATPGVSGYINFISITELVIKHEQRFIQRTGIALFKRGRIGGQRTRTAINIIDGVIALPRES